MMDEAAARRERLKALKAAQQLVEGDTSAGAAAAAAKAEAAAAEPAEPEKPVLKFRNYTVKDEQNIQHEKVAPAQPPKLAADTELGTKPEEADEEELLASMAPKKANWDLKREIEPRLAKLERRTQRALVEIMLEEEQKRMQLEGGVAD